MIIGQVKSIEELRAVHARDFNRNLDGKIRRLDDNIEGSNLIMGGSLVAASAAVLGVIGTVALAPALAPIVGVPLFAIASGSLAVTGLSAISKKIFSSIQFDTRMNSNSDRREYINDALVKSAERFDKLGPKFTSPDEKIASDWLSSKKTNKLAPG